MKKEARQLQALTLIEVLVVIAVMFILAALFLPALSNGDRKPTRTACVSQLRQIGVAFVMYADDNNGQYPWQVAASNGGTLEFSSTSYTFPHFGKLSNYMRQPQILHCPSDRAKQAVTNYAALSDQSVSYFLNQDLARSNPAVSILAGDRHLQANGQPVKPGLFLLTTNMVMSWTRELHGGRGNLAFADGHAESIKPEVLNKRFQSQNLANNRLVIP